MRRPLRRPSCRPPSVRHVRRLSLRREEPEPPGMPLRTGQRREHCCFDRYLEGAPSWGACAWCGLARACSFRACANVCRRMPGCVRSSGGWSKGVSVSGVGDIRTPIEHLLSYCLGSCVARCVCSYAARSQQSTAEPRRPREFIEVCLDGSQRTTLSSVPTFVRLLCPVGPGGH